MANAQMKAQANAQFQSEIDAMKRSYDDLNGKIADGYKKMAEYR